MTETAAIELPAPSRPHLVDLGPYRNNVGATGAADLEGGRLNVWRNSFPSAELPPAGTPFVPAGVPFAFPPVATGVPDNVVCTGQRIDLPPGRYDWLYLLACAERRSEDVVHLHYASGAVDGEPLRVSDFWPGSPPRFGEIEAVRCENIHFPRHVQARVGPRIWQQRLPVPRQEALSYIRLPLNIAIHLFAVTAVSTGTGGPS